MKTHQLGATIEKDPNSMKYILMMNGTKASFAEYAKWSKKDMKANVAFMRTFSKQLEDEGVYVTTEGLGWADQAKLVRAGKDSAPITDGIFPESIEFRAGYWIVAVAASARDKVLALDGFAHQDRQNWEWVSDARN